MAENLAKLNKFIPDLKAIRAFIEFVISGAPPTSYFGIQGIKHQDKPTPGYFSYKHFKVVDVDKAIGYIQQLVSDNRSVYIQCTPLKSPPTGRGTKEFVSGSTLLWVDCDAKEYTRAQLIQMIDNADPAPSMIVDSGNGFHVYWKLEEFITSAADIESRNSALDKMLHGDGCTSCEHILRIPGTFNFKKLTDVREVKVYRHTDTAYSLAEFPVLEKDIETTGLFSIIEEDVAEDELLVLPNDLMNRIAYGDPAGDRSSNDWFVATSLLEYNFTPGQLLHIFMCGKYAVGEKAREQNGIRYALSTIIKATAVAKKRKRVAPKALLQPMIDQLIKDERGKPTLNLPIQSYDYLKSVCVFLGEQGYGFVFDEASNTPFFVTPEGELVHADLMNRHFVNLVTHITLFTPDTRAHRMFSTGIIAYIGESGIKTNTRPWTWVDTNRNRLYVLTDHTKYRSIVLGKAGSNTLQIEKNGLDGNMFFPSELTQGNDIELTEDLTDVNYQEFLSGLFDLTYNYFAVADSMKALLTCYMLAIPIAHAYLGHTSLLPVLHITGKQGQGKSDILKAICGFIHGCEPDSGTTVAAARSISSKDVFLALDDYEKIDSHLRQFILTAATGSVQHKKAQDTVTTLTQKNHILIALSSIGDLGSPPLRRRSLRVEVSSTKFGTPGFNTLFKDKIKKNRSMFWSAYVKFVVSRLMPKLSPELIMVRAERIRRKILVADYKPHADFLALCSLIGEELALFDKRFESYSNPNKMDCWLSYFNMYESEDLESYDQLPGMLSSLLEKTVGDIVNGNTSNQILSTPSPCGGKYCTTPKLLDGLSIESPNFEWCSERDPILGDQLPTPFNQKNTICVVGRSNAWVSSLARNGFREYFVGMDNVAKQFMVRLNNAVGIVREDKEVETAIATGIENSIGCKYTPFYRIGKTNLWIQFVTRDGAIPFLRVFMETEAYVAPSHQLTIKPKNRLIDAMQELQMKLAKGTLTKEEAEIFSALLNNLKDKK